MNTHSTLVRLSPFSLILATLVLCLAEAGPLHAQSSKPLEGVDDRKSLLGSSVIGPGSVTIGVIEDLVVDQNTNEVAMYLVKTNGWFGSYGVIPVKVTTALTPVTVDGVTTYLVGVAVNEATFDNIAKWDGEGPIGIYLRRYESILTTIYGLEKGALEGAADSFALAYPEVTESDVAANPAE